MVTSAHISNLYSDLKHRLLCIPCLSIVKAAFVEVCGSSHLTTLKSRRTPPPERAFCPFMTFCRLYYPSRAYHVQRVSRFVNLLQVEFMEFQYVHLHTFCSYYCYDNLCQSKAYAPTMIFFYGLNRSSLLLRIFFSGLETCHGSIDTLSHLEELVIWWEYFNPATSHQHVQDHLNYSGTFGLWF